MGLFYCGNISVGDVEKGEKREREREREKNELDSNVEHKILP